MVPHHIKHKHEQIANNTKLSTAGCTLDKNVHHLHTETKIFPIDTHTKLHGSQLRQQAQDPEHTLHWLTTQEPPARLKKQIIFHNNIYTTDIDTPPDSTTRETIKANTAQIHTQIVANYMQTIPHNKVLNRTPPEISNTEQALPHYTRRLLAQLRTNKSSILHEYLHKITPEIHPTPNCPLCHSQPHDTQHIFGCSRLPTDLGPVALWDEPGGTGGAALVGSAGVGPGVGMRGGGGRVGPPWGRQQQQVFYK